MILGITFKKNSLITDNSKIVDIYFQLLKKQIDIDIYDPLADKVEVFKNYKIKLSDNPSGHYDIILLAVPHDEFLSFNYEVISKPSTIKLDINSFQ